MRRIVLAALLPLLGLFGCKNQKAKPAYREEPYTPTYTSLDTLDQQAPASAAPQATSEPQTRAPDTAAASETTADQPLEPVAPAGRTYVVRKGDTLFALARRFYNDQRRWRDIWQANRDKLPDPNKLSVGMTLVIPE